MTCYEIFHLQFCSTLLQIKFWFVCSSRRPSAWDPYNCYFELSIELITKNSSQYYTEEGHTGVIFQVWTATAAKKDWNFIPLEVAYCECLSTLYSDIYFKLLVIWNLWKHLLHCFFSQIHGKFSLRKRDVVFTLWSELIGYMTFHCLGLKPSSWWM